MPNVDTGVKSTLKLTPNRKLYVFNHFLAIFMYFGTPQGYYTVLKTAVSTLQLNFFENATACSKRRLKTRVATQLYDILVTKNQRKYIYCFHQTWLLNYSVQLTLHDVLFSNRFYSKFMLNLELIDCLHKISVKQSNVT